LTRAHELLGEFGAIQRTEYPELTGTDLNLHRASRTYFHKTAVDKANSKGLRPVYWDNGWAGNDGFALIDRYTAALIDPDNATALTGGPALPPPPPPPGTAPCRAPAYDPNATYCKGDIVSFNLRDWMWENKRGRGACGANDAPGGFADPWKDLGVCAK
jgi:hypothetical protein